MIEANIAGDWVVDSIGDMWIIKNKVNGKTKRIGKVRTSGTNNFDRAMAEANARNKEAKAVIIRMSEFLNLKVAV